MKVYKSDIYSFIDKVEEKAIKHVQDEFLENIKILKEDNRLRGIIYDYNAFKSSAQIIKDIYDKYSSISNVGVNKFVLRPIERPELVIYKRSYKDIDIRGLDALLLTYVFSYVDDYPEYSWVTTYFEKVEGVKREYSKLRLLIESTKSNNICISILENLGYDVTSLINKNNKEKFLGLDKSKLLVCKEGENH